MRPNRFWGLASNFIDLQHVSILLDSLYEPIADAAVPPNRIFITAHAPAFTSFSSSTRAANRSPSTSNVHHLSPTATSCSLNALYIFLCAAFSGLEPNHLGHLSIIVFQFMTFRLRNKSSNHGGAWSPNSADARLLLYGPKNRIQRIGGFIMGVFNLLVGMISIGAVLAFPIIDGPRAPLVSAVMVLACSLIGLFFSVVGFRLIRTSIRSRP